MRGRSTEQIALYERHLAAIASLLASSPMSVKDVVEHLVGTPDACCEVTAYARIKALAEHGYDLRWKRRRKKIPGKSGQREWVFRVVLAVKPVTVFRRRLGRVKLRAAAKRKSRRRERGRLVGGERK